MDFSSDTSAPVHPNVIAALADANHGMASSYGNDEATAELLKAVQATFETEDVSILPVISGTAANALALSVLCGSAESIACHEEAHIARDERGAPEFYTGGGKLDLLQGKHGKIDVRRFKAACSRIDRSFVHETPLAVLSLTNLTECGAAYSLEELRLLTKTAKQGGLSVHLDGARIANAINSTGVTPAEMSWKSDVDVLTLGLTKTGAMGCEIICLFGEAQKKYPQLLARAKRGGHLPPKMRFMSAQGVAMLKDGLWLELARQANASAARLADILTSDFGAQLTHPVDGNEVFATLPDEALTRLFDAGLKAYPWGDGSVRFVCHWTNSELDFESLSRLI